METIKLNVDGMSCEHCRAAVKKSLEQLHGIEDADVSLENKQVVIRYNPAVIHKAAFTKAIAEAGYTVV